MTHIWAQLVFGLSFCRLKKKTSLILKTQLHPQMRFSHFFTGTCLLYIVDALPLTNHGLHELGPNFDFDFNDDSVIRLDDDSDVSDVGQGISANLNQIIYPSTVYTPDVPLYKGKDEFQNAIIRVEDNVWRCGDDVACPVVVGFGGANVPYFRPELIQIEGDARVYILMCPDERGTPYYPNNVRTLCENNVTISLPGAWDITYPLDTEYASHIAWNAMNKMVGVPLILNQSVGYRVFNPFNPPFN